MGFLKKFHPYAIIAAALLVFTFPVLLNRTLTNFSDSYAIAPWSALKPAGWFHSKSVDGSPIYFFNPSDLLNRELLREGKAFAWNPYVGFGAPWLGVMQGAPYFPSKLISMLSPSYWRGQDAQLIFMLLLAGVGNYLLLRSMGVGRDGAIFSGLAYMFCQRLFLIINMPAFTIECLLPLMLYAVNEMMKRRSIRFALLAGVVGGVQFLGGFPETSFMLGLVSSLFFLWLLFQNPRSLNKIKCGLLLALIVAALAIAIGGFQLAEFAKLLFASQTAHTASYGTVVKEPFWLLPMFLPNFFGTPFESFWISEISPYDTMPSSLFCGISTVLLAIMALLWRTAPNRTYIWFFVTLLFVFIGYDYGFPILKYIGHLPLINMMSTAWNAFVIPFALSVLAGFGFQSLRQHSAGRHLAIAGVVYCVAVILLCLLLPQKNVPAIERSFVTLIYVVPLFVLGYFLIRRWNTRPLGSHLLFALIVLESYLCVSGFGFLHYYGPSMPVPPSLVWLKQNVGHERVFGVNGVFPANTLMPDRIRDIRHLDGMYPGLYVDYADAIWPGARSNVYEIGNPQWTSFADPLLDLAAVKYVVFPQPLIHVPGGYSEVYSDPAVTSYRNNAAFARARYVPNVLEPPDRFTPAILKARIKELRTGVFLEDYSKYGPVMRSCPAPALPPVEFLQDDPGRVRLRVDAPCDGFVVLADLFFPGWQATVNGHNARIYKANYAFRAVEVRAGANDIVMTYRPAAWRFGAPLAAATLISVFVAGAFHLVRRWRRLPE